MSTAYEYVSQSEKHTSRPLLVRELVMPSFQSVENVPSTGEQGDYTITHEFADRDGVRIREVSIPDISDSVPDIYAVREKIAGYLVQMAQHPEWVAPAVEVDEAGERRLAYNNPIAEEMYTAMPAMASWRKEIVPGAAALYPLQYPEESRLPNGVIIDDLTRETFIHASDGRGIRSRAKVMSLLAGEYINADEVTNWTSLACGAAVPVLNAIEDNGKNIHGINLKLVDFDPEALEFAGALAQNRQLTEGQDFELLNRNLLKELIATDRLVQELGEESMDFVDALGIFEYFKKRASARFLANAYRLVKPGGALVAANMLDTHPEIDFNQRVIGWPTIYPRSVEDLKGIISEAGIDPKNVSITIPSDGIYAVFEIKK